MGTILTTYGDDAYDHEGYAAQLLDDGSLTGTYSSETMPRMVGQLVAACDCGWTGSTRYPSTGPFDDAAQELALADWEHSHARPTLEGLRTLHWGRLGTRLRQLADSHRTTNASLSDLTPAAQRELLDRTLEALAPATELTRALRQPLETASGGAQ